MTDVNENEEVVVEEEAPEETPVEQTGHNDVTYTNIEIK